MIPTTPAPVLDDDTPLADFADCHQEIVSHLQSLGNLPTLLEPAEQARRIAEEALRFFRKAVFDHHADEEKELFPAVLAASDRGAERDTVRRMVQSLTKEHREIEAVWAGLEPQLRKVAQGRPAEVDVPAVKELVRDYTAHARFEEAEFLPLCREILGRSGPGMAELGLSLHMRQTFRAYRRGINAS